MTRWLWRSLRRRYGWLNPAHPISRRDTRWMQQDLPSFIRRMTNPWTLLGYAAVMHGVMFVISLILYNYLSMTVAQSVLPVLSPFLTPFGTPLAAALLHSIVYWVLMLGICHSVTYSVAREHETHTWSLLRLTPYSTDEMLLAKLMVVGRAWWGIFRTLTVIRLAVLIVIPIVVASQQSRGEGVYLGLDLISLAVFILQPFVEALCVAGLSALAANQVRSVMWARFAGYGALFVTIFGLNGLMALWMSFTSPFGALSGLLVPLGHWTPLIASAMSPANPALYALQTIILVITMLILPLTIGIVALKLTARQLRAGTA